MEEVRSGQAKGKPNQGGVEYYFEGFSIRLFNR